MPMLPDSHQMDLMETACLALFDEGRPLSALAAAEALLALPDLPMHCPGHHYLTPAALLTAAHRACGSPRERLCADLKLAKERSAIIPGGVCGQYGCCGAAIGAGIFASVWQKTSPLSKTGWAAGNRMTARCLDAIASVEGPRCCKRVTYLTLSAAVSAARELLELDLGAAGDIRCPYSGKNRECRKDACPFFRAEPAKEEAVC